MNSAKMNSNSNKAITTEEWFEEQDYDADESWNKVLDDAEAFFSVDFCEESHKEQHDELYELWKDFQENCTECCNCGENVSNKDGMDGNLVDDEFWCVDCVDDEAHKCFSCNKFVTETEYLPSKEDEEKQQLLGHDYCLECYKNVEPICCVGCGKDGVFPKNRDGDTMCESCHSDGEEEEEYTIEIPVVGLGYCRYYDKEDRDKYVVYCKNAVWKMKGDKTARDMEGNYCETESEAEEEEDLCEKCDDCEGKCRSDETESCEKCSIELRIGCGNNPSDHSIFNGFCDDCREE